MAVSTSPQDNPDKLVLLAQQGDSRCRNELLAAYHSFIIQIASQFCHRYLREGVDEEISVALLAFNEAIDNYRPGQGAQFLYFARMVIKRRLTDYLRRSAAWNREIPFSGMQTDTENNSGIEAVEKTAAVTAFVEEEASFDRREEILYFCKRLNDFGISVRDLVRASPKHADARQRALFVARAIAENDLWRKHFLTRKELPLKDMENSMPVSRKTLERQRKYIVALLLVYTEDLPYIREYLKGGFLDENMRDCH